MEETKKKILIVEDEESLGNALRDKLEAVGYDVLIAKNGEDGLVLAKQKVPDLILLDIVMPVLDGIGMLEKLRADEWGKDAQVVMLTNLSDREKLAECMNYGTFDYFVKSDTKLDEIVEKVKAKIF